MASQFLTENHDDTHEGDERKERRRVQNRLNQRASRKSPKRMYGHRGDGSQNTTIGKRKKLSRPPAQKWTIYIDQTRRTVHFCHLGLQARQTILRNLRDHINQAMATYTLSSELLLPVTQWNIIRAMSTNAITMGLNTALLAEDILSPFNTSSPTTTNLPPSLQPTDLQKRIIHHPWIDLFAVSSIRDALLRNLHLYSEDELCHDLFGSSGDCSQPTGLLIWGEPWDSFAYEISDEMLRKWGWLWSGCTEALQSTNYWRLQRGEETLETITMRAISLPN